MSDNKRWPDSTPANLVLQGENWVVVVRDLNEVGRNYVDDTVRMWKEGLAMNLGDDSIAEAVEMVHISPGAHNRLIRREGRKLWDNICHRIDSNLRDRQEVRDALSAKPTATNVAVGTRYATSLLKTLDVLKSREISTPVYVISGIESWLLSSSIGPSGNAGHEPSVFTQTVRTWLNTGLRFRALWVLKDEESHMIKSIFQNPFTHQSGNASYLWAHSLSVLEEDLSPTSVRDELNDGSQSEPESEGILGG